MELLGFLHKRFNERVDHIKEIRRISEEDDNNDETQETIFRIRRNIFGVIEMIGRLYKENVISINVIHHILLSLFHFNEYESKKRFVNHSAPEEIEAIIVMWNYISEDLKNSKIEAERVYYEEYMYLFEQIRKINKDSRIDFLLMDIFENGEGEEENEENEEDAEDDVLAKERRAESELKESIKKKKHSTELYFTHLPVFPSSFAAAEPVEPLRQVPNQHQPTHQSS
jgi:hypothetical protein